MTHWLIEDNGVSISEYCKRCGAKVVLPIEHSLVCKGEEE